MVGLWAWLAGHEVTPVALLAAGFAAVAMRCVWRPARGPRLQSHDHRPPPAWLAPRADSVPPRHRLLVAALVAVAGLAVSPGAVVVTAPVVGLAAAAAYVTLGRVTAPRVRRQRQRLVDELPRALNLLSCALTVGVPVRSAVRDVSRVSPPATSEVLAQVVARTVTGMSDEEAWRAVTDDPVAAPVWGPVARDLARSVTTGAAVADVLREHAADARRHRRDALELRARSAGVASVLPMMCCFMPAFVCAGIVPIIVGLALHLRIG